MKDLTTLFQQAENAFNSLSLGEIILIVVPISMVVTFIYLITKTIFNTFLYYFSIRNSLFSLLNQTILLEIKKKIIVIWPS
ncbi:hypothetical protein JOC34_003425 [Virgibacillus halotolerans]|nr:hypothetical protein [Virgibacillus halotolerans]